jgi:hypothetical protein
MIWEWHEQHGGVLLKCSITCCWHKTAVRVDFVRNDAAVATHSFEPYKLVFPLPEGLLCVRE